MNELFLWLGIDAWRPFLTALLLPPAPFILMTLLGARYLRRRAVTGWILVLVGSLGIWAMCTSVLSQGLSHWLLPPTRALSPGEVADLKRVQRTAIVIVGGGLRDLAPEYGVSELSAMGTERLRYGLWLSRETGLPILFSGGLAHGSKLGQSEAEIAARVAERDFGRSIKWLESGSRDTRENAYMSVPLLKAQGIERIVLVTHGYHMARTRGNFEKAIAAGGTAMQVVSAPMGLQPWFRPRPIDFLPTRDGFVQTRLVLHEWVGRLIGA